MKKKTSLFLLFVILSVSIMAGGTTATESPRPPFAGYLFAYFEGQGNQQEHLRFGISTDAVNWKALNRNYPVINSDTISKSGGIRDPHILRGENALFRFKSDGNPVITHKHTADPAALVEGDTLWLYTGHDFAGGQGGYKMKDWCVFSTTDMINWTEYPAPLKITDFAWDRTGAAYAAHVVKRGEKYYYYISTNGSGIGVAVSDRPEGPFKDVLGKPLLSNKDCFGATHSWVCIDPAVFIDDDGQAWIFWGNRICYYAKLKENMVEIDGEIKRIDFKGFNFTEAPWIHKNKGKYYLTYATGWPEKIAYAMADHIEGPYEYKGILSEIAGNSNTTHPAIVEFKGQWYFFTHNGGLHDGTSYSRSVCAELMRYNSDGTIQKINISTEGVNPDGASHQ